MVQFIDLDVDRDLAVFRVCVPVGLDGYLPAAEVLHRVTEELHRLPVEEVRAALLDFVLEFTRGHGVSPLASAIAALADVQRLWV